MTDPLQPSLPRHGEPGRLSTSSPLQPGWPCRWCSRALEWRLDRARHWLRAGLICTNCDRPGGITPT